VKDRPVRVLLDASAIIAFTRGSIDVGETIAEVNDESAAAGLPILCLVEATRAVSDVDQLDLLVAHPATAVLVPQPHNWQALAVTYETVGRLDAASAVLAAIDLDCLVLTGQSGLYGGLAGGGPIISI
jgi:ABC-type Fe2+-enterobactin transport system substrate-binding protein